VQKAKVYKKRVTKVLQVLQFVDGTNIISTDLLPK